MELKPLSQQAQNLKLGTYEHYSKKQYKVVAISRHSETLEEYVVYQQLYGDYSYWIRPLAMFCEMVSLNEKLIPRFSFIG